ncbi:ATP-binding protein [Streptomyces violaceusniger]|uniref:ATP-binding protein n=1 Tax=Streptomyces violaceusniger TaxID=68280 RepID=UPI0009C2DA92|nr:ATP-binding protein [Streptomyces hygroscopicus]AQW48422.1 hypothetical protein SHXM_01885 [Streptomyces hygroscopicus]
MIETHVLVEALLVGGLATTAVALIQERRTKGYLMRARGSTEREASRLRDLADQNWHMFAAAVSETRNLVEHRLPAVIDTEARGFPGVVVPTLVEPDLKGTSIESSHSAIQDLIREAVEATRTSIGRASRAGVRGVTDEAQTFLARLQMKIDEELDKYPQASSYHQSLTDIDHFATRALHMLQRLRILAGSWPGVQRANCTFREIIESARGRIDPYNRVFYTYLPQTAELFVEGRVVEPITVTLAELLSNATSYSSDRVTVYVQEVQAGYSIVVEDTGLGMNAFQRAAAERLFSNGAVLDTTNLGDEHQLGFAVVGRLANDYGFRVDVSAPSAGGGVKATLFVPRALIGDAPEEEFEVQSTSNSINEYLDRPSEAPGESPPAATVSGLPKRQRRRPAAAFADGTPQEAAAHADDLSTVTSGFDQLRRAFSAGYANDTDSEENHPHD